VPPFGLVRRVLRINVATFSSGIERARPGRSSDRSGRRALLAAERRRRLEALLVEQPDATLAELGARLDRPFGASTVDLWLRRLGWKYKKNSGRRRTEPARRRRKKKALA